VGRSLDLRENIESGLYDSEYLFPTCPIPSSLSLTMMIVLWFSTPITGTSYTRVDSSLILHFQVS
jgi:hypothetical protein